MKVQSSKTADVSSQNSSNQTAANGSQANEPNDLFTELFSSYASCLANNLSSNSDQSNDNLPSNSKEPVTSVDHVNEDAVINELLLNLMLPPQLPGLLNSPPASESLNQNKLLPTINSNTIIPVAIKPELPKMDITDAKVLAANTPLPLITTQQPAIALSKDDDTHQIETDFKAWLQQQMADTKNQNKLFTKANTKDDNTVAISSPIKPLTEIVPSAHTNTTNIYIPEKLTLSHLDISKSKYEAALIQLGDLINSQTSKENIVSTQPLAMTDEVENLNYQQNMNKVIQPAYELKVDIQHLGSALNETYNANIKIYPPELGAMIAKLKVGKNGTELEIVTENTRVKEIVEANLGQLRQNFQTADINLTNIQISVQTSDSSHKEHQSSPQQEFNGPNDLNNSIANSSERSLPKKTSQVINSIIDTYA